MYVLLVVVCPFVLFLLAIVFSVLRFTDSDYPFGIFKLFLQWVVVIVWYLHIKSLVQSVPMTTNVGGSNPAHGDVYSIQHYVIKIDSDLRQVGGFLRYSCFLHQ